MRTPINLESTVFDMTAVVTTLEDDDERFLTISHKGKFTKMVDFGSVIIGPSGNDPQVSWFLEESPRTVNTLFAAPVTWDMGQLVRALGAFKSAKDARRNGWDKQVPEGFSQHVVRIGHVRGVIHVLKLVHTCPTCARLMVSDLVSHTCES